MIRPIPERYGAFWPLVSFLLLALLLVLLLSRLRC